MFNKLFLKIIFLVFPCTLLGHELWIDTTDFKVEKDTIKVSLFSDLSQITFVNIDQVKGINK